MAKKPFPIEGVFGVVTGYCLKVSGWGDVQDVMNHLYPGIMTIGTAAMQPTAAEELQRQHPKIREFLRTAPELKGDSLSNEAVDDFMSLARACFGDTLDVDGPHSVSNSQIADAFAALKT